MRAWIVVAIVTGAVAGCGGSSESSGSGGGSGAGGSGAADASSGGSAATASGGGSGGTSSGGTAGTSGGGTSAGGTSTGGATTGGTSSGGVAGTAGGAAGAAGMDAGTLTVCGGKLGTQCAATEWCDFAGNCGATDQTGLCKPRPLTCPDTCPGICGCDGQFYCNPCKAAAVGVDVTKDKSCMPDAAIVDGGVGTTCTTDAQCATGLKCCYPCGIPGCDNKCMQPTKNGQCPLFP